MNVSERAEALDLFLAELGVQGLSRRCLAQATFQFVAHRGQATRIGGRKVAKFRGV